MRYSRVSILTKFRYWSIVGTYVSPRSRYFDICRKKPDPGRFFLIPNLGNACAQISGLSGLTNWILHRNLVKNYTNIVLWNWQNSSCTTAVCSRRRFISHRQNINVLNALILCNSNFCDFCCFSHVVYVGRIAVTDFLNCQVFYIYFCYFVIFTH